jgi:hypothetical protein
MIIIIVIKRKISDVSSLMETKIFVIPQDVPNLKSFPNPDVFHELRLQTLRLGSQSLSFGNSD